MTASTPLSDFPLRAGLILPLSAGMMFLILATVTVMTLSGLVGQQLAPSPALATLPVAAMVVGTALSTVPAAAIMGRWGRHVGFVTGTGVGALGGAVAAAAIMAGSFWAFCLGNALIGVYQAFGQHYRFAAADSAPAQRRGLAVSLVLAGGIVAAASGSWIARAGVDVLPQVPYAGAYVFVMAFSVLAMAVVSRVRLGGHAQEAAGASTAPARPFVAIARQPAFPVAVAGAAMGYAVMNLIMVATPLAMRDVGLGLGATAFVMQSHVLGMFVPSLISGWLIDRFGVLRIMASGAVLILACCLIAGAGMGLWHFWGALVLLGVGWNFLFVGGTTLLARTYRGAERARIQGLNDLMVFSSVAAAALLSGLLLNQVGWGAILVVGSLPTTLVLGAIVWLAMVERARPAISTS